MDPAGFELEAYCGREPAAEIPSEAEAPTTMTECRVPLTLRAPQAVSAKSRLVARLAVTTVLVGFLIGQRPTSPTALGGLKPMTLKNT